jgi:hypothetical protein
MEVQSSGGSRLNEFEIDELARAIARELHQQRLQHPEPASAAHRDDHHESELDFDA